MAPTNSSHRMNALNVMRSQMEPTMIAGRLHEDDLEEHQRVRAAS
jgi:hypothetical protein